MDTSPQKTIPDALQLPQDFNIADHLILPNLVAERINTPYMACGGQELTFGELHKKANKFGNVLRRLGVRPEERVMLLMAEGLDYSPVFWGAIRMGAVAVPLNTVLTPRDYAYYLRDSHARVLVVDSALWSKIAPLEKDLPHLEHIIISGSTQSNGPSELGGGTGRETGGGIVKGKPSLESLMMWESEELRTEMMSPDLPAFWLYTSGSTGRPKAAVHLHRNMAWVARHFMRALLPVGSGDITFSSPKMFFAYGLANSLYGPLVTGAMALVQRDAASAENCFALLQRHKPVIFYAVPTLLNAMVNLYEAWQRGEGNPPEIMPNLGFLRFVYSAGETLPVNLYQRWQTLFGVKVLDGIGSTELLNFYIANTEARHKPGSTGVLVPGYEARLVDDNGNTVLPGVEGNLWIKGGSAAGWYWNNLSRTRAVMKGEWVVTGDRFHQDESGYFYYHGRSDDMMKIGGSWVSPAEVENALLAHSAVAECAVVGQYDIDGLMKARAFVVLASGKEGDDNLALAMKEAVMEQLAAFKVPHWVEFVAELPKTATGKIQRFLLREKTEAARPH